MKDVNVSIIVPVYNAEKYLNRCVQSLIIQTIKSIEIILVDDGSTDNCPEMCDAWSRNDCRISVIHKKNGGLGMACNSGLEKARGKYVAFVDSDDWVEADMYQKLYDTARRNNAHMVFSGIRRVDENGKISPMYQSSALTVYSTKDKIDSLMLDMIASEPSVRMERKIPMSAKIVLYDRSMIISHNIQFDSERVFISEDLLFNLECMSKSKCIVEFPDTFYNYYINTTSISHTIYPGKFEKAKLLHQELIRRCTHYNLPICFQDRIDRLIIGYGRSNCNSYFHCQLPFCKKKHIVSDICSDEIWTEIRKRYPIKAMPFIHRFFFELMTHKMVICLYLISKIQYS